MPRESESPLISHSHGREARIMYLVGSQRLRAAGVRPTHGLLTSTRLSTATMRHAPRGSWLVGRGVQSGRGVSGPESQSVMSSQVFVFRLVPLSAVRSYGVGRSDRVRWARAAAAALRALAAARPRWPRCVSTVFHQPRAGCTARNNDKRTNAGRARKSGQRSGFRSPRASRAVASGARGAVRSPKLQKEAKSQRPNEPRRHPTIRICCNHS